MLLLLLLLLRCGGGVVAVASPPPPAGLPTSLTACAVCVRALLCPLLAAAAASEVEHHRVQVSLAECDSQAQALAASTTALGEAHRLLAGHTSDLDVLSDR